MIVQRMQDRQEGNSTRPRAARILSIVCAALLGVAALAAFLSHGRPSSVFAALGTPQGSGALENFSHRDQDGMTAEQDHGEFTTSANHDQVLTFYRNACLRAGLAVIPAGAGPLPLGFARSALVCRGERRGERFAAAIDTRCDTGECRLFLDVVTD